jgi:hypothetical protein
MTGQGHKSVGVEAMKTDTATIVGANEITEIESSTYMVRFRYPKIPCANSGPLRLNFTTFTSGLLRPSFNTTWPKALLG